MAKSWCSKAHFGSLLSKLKQLQTDDLLTDTTIKAGTQEFKVHRAVLIACCGYSPFNLDVQEGSQSTITIDDLPSDSVMQLLNFCYTGRIAHNSLFSGFEIKVHVFQTADWFKSRQSKYHIFGYFELI